MFTRQLTYDILRHGGNIGALGENVAYNRFFALGLTVQYTAKIGACGDLLVNGRKIEVKSARSSKRGEYKFCLQKKDKYGYTDYQDSDYVLLQCFDNNGGIVLYFIPSADISVRHMCISANSRKYAQYHIPTYGSTQL